MSKLIHDRATSASSTADMATLTKVPLGNKLWWWLGLIVYYCWFQALYITLRHGDIEGYDLVITIVSNIIPIGIIWWTYIGIVYRWVQIQDRLLKIIVDVLSAFLAAVLLNLSFSILYPVFTGYKAEIDWSGTLLNDFLVLMLIEITFHFKSLLLFQSEVERMRQEVMRHKYDALKAQVNPHFLFNSFNLLYSLVTVDPGQARLFIQNLAETYRYVLDRHERNRASASEELDFIKSYINVLMIRYRDKFSVKWTGISPDSPILADKALIPFTLQILVENVVKHNVVSTRSPMTIEIFISADGIRVTNPLQPKPTASRNSSGFGLNYLKNTYASEGRTLRISDDKERGVFEIYFEWLPKDSAAMPKHDNTAQE